MTTTLNLTRTRGDTFPIRMTMTNPDGTPMDLTNKQVLLTVNTEEDPTDDSTQIFQIVGTITDALAGTVSFEWDAQIADFVGLFYFDVEVSDVYVEPPYVAPNEWTAAGTIGERAIIDGSEFWHGISDTTVLDQVNMTYREIDGIRVGMLEGSAGGTLYLYPYPPVSDLTAFGAGVFEFTGLFYIGAPSMFRIEHGHSGSPNNYTRLTFSNGFPPIEGRVTYTSFNDLLAIWNDEQMEFSATYPEWYQFRIRIAAMDEDNGANGIGPSVKMNYWINGDTEPTSWWFETYPAIGSNSRIIARPIRILLSRSSASDDVGIAEFGWERIT